ncbi:hypothetical protein R3I94_001370 [Phoxinus phoxinus]|uniref:Uncharacterized protein n=1 Tax=Phoxinus phoxinus TaxID=58324 RepID=A0AAN9DRU3_9TELE
MRFVGRAAKAPALGPLRSS